MTSSIPPEVATAAPARLRVPGAIPWLLFAAPFLMAFGAFVTVAMQPFVARLPVEGSAVLMAWVGVIVLCLGVVFLTAGIVVLGVRSIVQQQIELVHGSRPDGDVHVIP